MHIEAQIVFIHQGHSWYLPYALYQAQHASPDAEIVLLGQTPYKDIKAIALESLCGSKGEDDFRKNYFHMSTNSQDFELFCFLRWFFLLQYMRLNEIDVVFHFDSDVLLYSPIQGIWDIYASKEIGGGYMVPRQEGEFGAASAHSSFWTRGLLERFCDFLVQWYSRKEHLNKLKGFWTNYSAAGKPGGICDMTLLYMFWRDNSSHIVNLELEHQGGIFDHNINGAMEDEYEVHGGMKKLDFADGFPLLFKVGGKVRAHALHFQGEAKGHMALYYKGGHFKGKLQADVIALLWRLRKRLRDFSRACGFTGFVKGLFRT